MSLDPATMSLIASLIPAITSVAGGFFGGGGGDTETKQQKMTRKTLDDILASIKGEGSFNDLFNLDEDAFQRSIVDPALRRFEQQTAPQIQQKFISSGLQRGTGLDDALTRAGVDLESNIDQLYGDFRNQGMERMMRALGLITGAGSGAANPLTSGQQFGQAAAGYASSPGFRDDISGILNYFTSGPAQIQEGGVSSGSRPGFEPSA